MHLYNWAKKIAAAEQMHLHPHDGCACLRCVTLCDMPMDVTVK
jgi:hypothetical protein